jgi:hypothetical protein
MKNLRNTKTIKLLALLFVSSLVFVSCSDDDHDDHDHEEELITTVLYTLSDGTNTIELEFQDLDGEGGALGTYDVSGPLMANTTYTGSIQLLNETENPAEDITEEVEHEADEHEFFYTSTVTGVTISKDDVDGDGNPLGIETTLTTGAAGTGTLTIILKHEPTKPNDGTATGAGGSTDVEVTFDIEVQ